MDYKFITIKPEDIKGSYDLKVSAKGTEPLTNICEHGQCHECCLLCIAKPNVVKI